MKKCVLIGLAIAAAALPVAANDWPRWRGPKNDNISTDTQFSTQWPAAAKKVWAAPVDIGYASPIAADGVVYVFTSLSKKDTLTAFKADSGQRVWQESYDNAWTGGYAGTRATPAIDGGNIFTFGGAGDLTSRDLKTRKANWQTNVISTLKAGNLQWGASSNMLIDGDLIYVQTGENAPIAVAVNKSNGQITHRSVVKDKAGYAAPILAEVGGKKQIIVFGASTIYGLSPDLQTKLWSTPWRTDWDVNASTPIYSDGKLFVTSGYKTGGGLYEITDKGAKQLWFNGDLKSRFQGAVLDGGYLYMATEAKKPDGRVVVAEWATGKIVAELPDRGTELGMGGSVVRHGNHLVGLSERGSLSLYSATKDGIKRVTEYRNVVDGSQVWSTPLIYNGNIYVKGKDEIVCISTRP